MYLRAAFNPIICLSSWQSSCSSGDIQVKEDVTRKILYHTSVVISIESGRVRQQPGTFTASGLQTHYGCSTIKRFFLLPFQFKMHNMQVLLHVNTFNLFFLLNKHTNLYLNFICHTNHQYQQYPLKLNNREKTKHQMHSF